MCFDHPKNIYNKPMKTITNNQIECSKHREWMDEFNNIYGQKDEQQEGK